jgi:glutathione peroxidase
MKNRRALLGSAAAAIIAAPFAFASATRPAPQLAHGFSFESIDGGSLPLAQFRGRVLLVVNTASQCGFTGQYEGLQALWTRLRPRGLTIVGVPSNDFGGQEPGSNAQIQSFCRLNYGVDFPLAARTTVVGVRAHPFFAWAQRQLGEAARPSWNFHKILIGKDGRAIAAFPSRVAPDGPQLVAAIEAALRQ